MTSNGFLSGPHSHLLGLWNLGKVRVERTSADITMTSGPVSNLNGTSCPSINMVLFQVVVFLALMALRKGVS